MRISDWSSDVCSSDLRPEAGRLANDRMLASKRSRSARDATAQASAAEAFGVVTGSATREHRGIVGGGVDRERIIEHRCRLRRRSEEHTSELQSLMRISYAVFCLKKKHQLTTTLDT